MVVGAEDWGILAHFPAWAAAHACRNPDEIILRSAKCGVLDYGPHLLRRQAIA